MFSNGLKIGRDDDDDEVEIFQATRDRRKMRHLYRKICGENKLLR